MSETGLVQILEGAILAAGKPVSVTQLANLFEQHERPENTEIREALKEVAERCEDRGFELQEVASGFRFQVRQSLAAWVGRLWTERAPKYSRALLETLSLIAYRQPITRGEIEEIRGVAVSTNIIKTLHEREWIRVVGHRDVPGRPAMYATTRQFLDYFSLKSLDQLPALAEIRDLETLNAELGFSDPIPEDGAPNTEQVETPGLTVVGGTEHVPAQEEEAGADAVSLSDAADELESRVTDSFSADEESIDENADATDEAETRLSEPSDNDSDGDAPSLNDEVSVNASLNQAEVSSLDAEGSSLDAEDSASDTEDFSLGAEGSTIEAEGSPFEAESSAELNEPSSDNSEVSLEDDVVPEEFPEAEAAKPESQA
ncbi:MAG: segregation and condensation protein B [Halioglobus sp.]|jgi:segregation and condensation protein B